MSRQDGWRGSRMKERRSFSCVVGVSPVACGVRAARCQSRRVLGVSRVVRSHRVVRSLASSRRLSSRVVCRRVVRSLASSRRLSSRVVCRLAVRRPAGRCQSRRVRSRVGVSRVSSCVVPLLGVSRVRVRSPAASSCQSQSPFFLFQTRWMTFFFVLY